MNQQKESRAKTRRTFRTKYRLDDETDKVYGSSRKREMGNVAHADRVAEAVAFFSQGRNGSLGDTDEKDPAQDPSAG